MAFSKSNLKRHNANRTMWTVTLTCADGRQIMRESRGTMPDMTPAVQPGVEPEESVEE